MLGAEIRVNSTFVSSLSQKDAHNLSDGVLFCCSEALIRLKWVDIRHNCCRILRQMQKAKLIQHAKELLENQFPKVIPFRKSLFFDRVLIESASKKLLIEA